MDVTIDGTSFASPENLTIQWNDLSDFFRLYDAGDNLLSFTSSIAGIREDGNDPVWQVILDAPDDITPKRLTLRGGFLAGQTDYLRTKRLGFQDLEIPYPTLRGTGRIPLDEPVWRKSGSPLKTPTALKARADIDLLGKYAFPKPHIKESMVNMLSLTPQQQKNVLSLSVMEKVWIDAVFRPQEGRVNYGKHQVVITGIEHDASRTPSLRWNVKFRYAHQGNFRGRNAPAQHPTWTLNDPCIVQDRRQQLVTISVMAINSVKTWEAEAVDFQDMNTGIRNHLVHVVSSRNNLPSDMRQEPGVPWIELNSGAAILKINDASGSPVSVQSTINPTVSDPFQVANLEVSGGITLGGQRLTAWPAAGAGASTWIGLSDTPGDYGQEGQLPVSLGAGSEAQRIRWQSFASLIPPSISLTGNLSVGGNITLGGQTRDTWPAAGISNFVDCHDVHINLAQSASRYVVVNPAGTQIIAIQPSFLTSLAGVTTFSGTPADGKVLTGTSATTASWKSPAAAESFDLSGVTTISGASSHGAVLAGVNATTAAWSTTPSFSGLVTFQSGLTIPANEGITLGNVKRTTWPSATTGYSGTQETGAVILATDASVAAWTTTPTFGGLITASSDGISLGGVTRTTWPAGVEFGSSLPASPPDDLLFALTGEADGEGRGIQQAKSRTIPADTNSMTFQVQDQSWGVQEFYGFAVAQARSGDTSLLFGSQPAGYPKVKAFIWSIQLREMYVQVDADLTDQAAITIHAFGHQYDLNDRTSHFGPSAVNGTAQKVYYKDNLSIPASSNQLEQTISASGTLATRASE